VLGDERSGSAEPLFGQDQSASERTWWTAVMFSLVGRAETAVMFSLVGRAETAVMFSWLVERRQRSCFAGRSHGFCFAWSHLCTVENMGLLEAHRYWILSGRQPPHHYLSLKKRWKKAYLRVENDTEERGVTTYRMDPNAGVCGCSAYVTGMLGHGKTKKRREASENW
jgi:hypothetical protein